MIKEVGRTHENVTRPRDHPSPSQQLYDVPKLAMDVPTNGDGRGDGLNVGFLDENRTNSVAKSFDSVFR